MNSQPSKPNEAIIVYCDELCKSSICNSQELNLLNRDIDGLEANITIEFNKFVRNPENLSPRILDLLRIAAYVYCADRLINRGERDSLNNTAWSRAFEFHIPVSDIAFWSDGKVSTKMGEALAFMTGDRRFNFSFTKASLSPVNTDNQQLSLFSTEYITLDEAEKTDVMLFSGGLDSLAGAIQRLNDHNDRKLCLVSHKANNCTIRTQNATAKHLRDKYSNRAIQYGFECHNKKAAPSREETQRSRMFLFSAIAFAICNCYEKKEFFVHENGITSINLPKQSDTFNARMSRTTHPKTIGLLREFFRLFDKDFNIITPYYNKTKSDILDIFKQYGEENIITSSVSCSSTRNKPKNSATHCGCCSQCIDRIFAIYASGLEDYDVTYADDIIKEILDKKTAQHLYNTLRLACAESSRTKDELFRSYTDEITDVINYWPNDNPDDSLDEIFQLYGRFGDSVMKAIKSIQLKFEDPRVPVNKNSLLGIVAEREYLNTPVQIRVNEMDTILRKAIPMSFQREKPKDENDMNDKVQALLSTQGEFTREYPALQFGETAYKADHAKDGLIIESKFPRGKTAKSTVSEGIAADITKIPSSVAGILFVVYDPERKITDDDLFISTFEATRQNCFVRIYR
ncbi:7-cyano-7-deazaguanine synthase [Pelotomaculum sp. FP]|uniref:7-cyano-7-deazaguanine synthase n=1 Tax=Pelotomaculum sp. FP TaxID=261474 RepID=UPI00106652B9|nr:7-cyano-7-deazaguanine synthase [Pelotomaculum sp. FP]TEB17504.1 7-cyano-7-deazaguanine synthase [Pelotomaculum sp. FP]